MSCPVFKSEFGRIVSEVWSVVPGLPLKRELSAEFRSPPLVASIKADGKWRGEVFLEIDNVLAESAAKSMFDIPETDAIPEDKLWDAIKELVNMFGGSLKSALPASCKLGLPRIVDRVPTSSLSPEGSVELDFSSDGLPFRLICIHDASAALDEAGALLDGLI